MKTEFFNYLRDLMRINPDIFIIFVGLGYPRVDEFMKEFEGRAINSEASEQTALDMAVGLSYEGKTPFVYTITPFLYRGFETIRTYINHENLNVKLVGAGRDDDYSREDGYSHDARDIKKILGTQENIDQFYPKNNDKLREYMDIMVKVEGPQFLSLTR